MKKLEYLSAFPLLSVLSGVYACAVAKAYCDLNEIQKFEGGKGKSGICVQIPSI